MYQDVLLPTDGTETTETVLNHTGEVTPREDGAVHVLYVVDDQAFLTLASEMKDEVIAELQLEGQKAVERTKASLEAEGFDVTTAVRNGKPADEIIEYVDEQNIDLVTMGTRGNEFTENMLGSTAQKVITDCSAPVLTVNISDRN